MRAFEAPKEEVSDFCFALPPLHGPKLFWTTTSCDTIAAADVVGDSDGILMVDETLSSLFEFDTPVSGDRVTVCYKFNGA